MTLLGKVFTALIFLLSVIFFALAVTVNATHIYWKEQANKFETSFKSKETEAQQIRVQLEKVKTQLAVEQAARRSTIASLQEELTTAKNDRESAERALRDLQSALTSSDQTNLANANELKARTEENTLLRQELKDAREDRDQMFQRLVDATDRINRIQGDMQSLVLLKNNLAENYTKAKEKLEVLGIKEDTILDAPPPVNGEVLAVDTSGLVEVSLGRDDGIRVGFTLEIHREGQYLGRILIRTVRDDKSVGRILEGYQRGYIRAGDSVQSRLSLGLATN